MLKFQAVSEKSAKNSRGTFFCRTLYNAKFHECLILCSIGLVVAMTRQLRTVTVLERQCQTHTENITSLQELDSSVDGIKIISSISYTTAYKLIGSIKQQMKRAHCSHQLMWCIVNLVILTHILSRMRCGRNGMGKFADKSRSVKMKWADRCASGELICRWKISRNVTP